MIIFSSHFNNITEGRPSCNWITHQNKHYNKDERTIDWSPQWLRSKEPSLHRSGKMSESHCHGPATDTQESVTRRQGQVLIYSACLRAMIGQTVQLTNGFLSRLNSLLAFSFTDVIQNKLQTPQRCNLVDLLHNCYEAWLYSISLLVCTMVYCLRKNVTKLKNLKQQLEYETWPFQHCY